MNLNEGHIHKHPIKQAFGYTLRNLTNINIKLSNFSMTDDIFLHFMVEP